VVEGERYVRAGKWQTWGPSLLLGNDIHGATLGIVGYGRIGQAVARRAAGFDMRVIYVDPNAPRVAAQSEWAAGPVSPETPSRESGVAVQSDWTATPVNPETWAAVPVDLETLLAESDFVSLHVPLTAATRHLIRRETLALMKSTAVLINTSRGPVVDPDALYEALKEHRIFAAALDVTDPEPLPLDSPLLTLDNLIVVPHIASASTATRTRMAVMAAENLIAGLKGERLPNCVNPQVYGASAG
jgi:glyoxylate reductase